MSAIYKKEIRSYFNSMNGYIFAAFFLAAAGVLTWLSNLKGMYPQFEVTLSGVAIAFLFLVPIITMRSIAEERQSKTDQLLYSLPVSVIKIVVGKFLALYTVFLITVGIISFYPILLSFFGEVNFGMTYACILGFLLMGGALLAVGFFLSSVTESQLIAAILSLGAMLVFLLAGVFSSSVSTTASTSFWAFTAAVVLIGGIVYLMTKDWWISGVVAMILETALIFVYNRYEAAFQGLIGKVLGWFSVLNRFYNFTYGIFDVKAVVYYLSIIVIFVFLTVQAVEKRRWS